MHFLRLFLLLTGLTLTTGVALAQDPPQGQPVAGGTEQKTPADTAKLLLDVLKDDAARAALVHSLESVASQPQGNGAVAPAAAQPDPASPAAAPAAPAQPAQAAPAVPSPPVPLARELTSVTQDLTRSFAEVLSKIWYGLGNLKRLVDGSAALNWDGIRDEGMALAVLVIFAFAVLNIARYLSRVAVRAVTPALEGVSRLRKVPWIVLAVAIDALTVGVTWFASSAYALASSIDGHVDLLQSLFIDAFVLIELTKVVLFALFQGRIPSLRLLPVSDQTGRFWYFWMSRILGFTGYGVMVVHPIVNQAIGFSVGIGFRLAVVLAALLASIALVGFKREHVRLGLAGLIEQVKSDTLRATLALLAHGWHLLVIVYLSVAFVLWVSRPFDAVDFMAKATIETVLALLLGGVAVTGLSQSIAHGIRLPADVKRPLPLLESRLNLLVPMFLRIVRFVILLLVAAAILQSWSLIDLMSWVESASGADLLGRLFSAMLLLMMAMAIWLAASSWVEYRLNPGLGRISNARTRTLLSLFRNAFSILLVVITTMLVLSQLGIDIAPLIAGAGVVGLAVGFGSQKLVQDIITGAFIQFENAMNEGDVVTVAGITGVVDRLTIRSVGIRDGEGVYHIIPFSSVGSVSNAMRGFAFHVANIDVAYKENIDEVKRCMGIAFDRLMATDRGSYILEPLEMQGVVQFGQSAVTVRARIKTLPGEQWATGRAYNEFIKQVFDENDIEIPYAQTKVWFAQAPEEHGVLPAAAYKAPKNPHYGPGKPRKPEETLDFDDKDDDGDGDEVR
ncbi:mechanosensitive ion channel domain-containing protein [Oryzibacter oryziterrae]|uniref:mechanosensitive ion channel domain-containing protein n=1 Tax=Oryzibacter oryziterrae TaxID=2766474 RepID=UPI001F00E28E|nr:mechanosensitive ion channel domain-containing protein [Oryzibacter oryziterrae]